ncbi:MAG TPA: asparagine synthase (glutamine-hydrolyzing) [Ferruginibacter sp.]|nr:asparagine synthase (glutamine-hydrolyzing) [Ferruginibacter sp.]HMP20628.1 asparagine synthase (glutamine-hydrolyzing) [Ferruginibacter sp.]
MCGIAGIIDKLTLKNQDQKTALLQRVKKMTDILAHRGPDGEGHWINQSGNVCLGHRRLAVIDLSANAAQPMHFNPAMPFETASPRYTITYNGEIYNYVELREELYKNGYRFRSHSDTEIILAAYDFWKEACVQHFDGMFAFAIWDEQEQMLFAARDRFGEKPFYMYFDERHFVFSSEMKAMWATGIPRQVDQKMLLNYLALGYVQNASDKEQTFFENIFALPPGHYLHFKTSVFDYSVHPYWELDKEATLTIAPETAIEEFTALFTTSVKRRLRSDVETGVSLSGGLDSSSIAATIYTLLKGSKQLSAFSAIFPGFEKDESAPIKQLATAYKLNSHTCTPTAEGFISEFQKLCYYQEEPFQSAGIYAQYKVFELAKKQGTKVLLDGQGADETLAGYYKYIHWYLQQLINRKRYREAISEKKKFRDNHMTFNWGIKNYIATFLPAHAAIHLEKNEYQRILRHPYLRRDFIRSMQGRELEGIYKPVVTKLNDILYFNTISMGLEELLRFCDRNSMAHSREVRLPFLSHELVAFIFSLPADFKIRGGCTKWLLRKAMENILPENITWRKDKIGFEPPQQQWMENPQMQEYIHEAKRILVNEAVLKADVLMEKVVPQAAYDEKGYDWRYLCAAQLYSNTEK